MAWIDSLCWTSRAEVCDRLAQYLFDTLPSPPPPGETDSSDGPAERLPAAHLLFSLAGPAHAPAVRQLLFDPRVELRVRVTAFRWLSDQRARFTSAELQQILADPVLREEDSYYLFDAQFLPLYDNALDHRVVLEYLWRKTASERTEVLDLITFAGEPDDPRGRITPSLWAHLYDRWLSRDREELERAGEEGCWLNLRAAFATRARAASQRLLREQWRRAGRDQRRALIRWLQPDWKLADQSWEHPGDEPLLRELLRDSAAGDPALLQAVLEELELPLAMLIEQLGPEPLLDRLFATIEEASRLLREKRRGDWTEAMERAYVLLWRWPDPAVNARIARMLQRPDPSPLPRGMLFWVLWERDRDRAQAVALYVAAEYGDRDLIRQCVQRGSDPPRAEDRGLFRQVAAEETDAETVCRALQALVALGEDGPRWREQLARWAGHANPSLSLPAAAALLRRGDADRRAEIEAAAVQTARPGRQATALGCLSAWDGARYADLFAQTLREGAARRGASPHALEPARAAALALARLGTPEAMTALLQACLLAEPERSLVGELSRLLVDRAGRQEGQRELPWRPWEGDDRGPRPPGVAAAERLSEADRRVIGECLTAAAEGPFFSDGVFHPIFGLWRWEVAEIAAAWPAVSDADADVALAINNALGNLTGYPHRCDAQWPEYLSVSREEVDRVFEEWRSHKGWNDNHE